jgi:hypothetical protein
MRISTHISFVGLFLLSGGITQAVPITYEFTGTVDSVYEPSNDFGGAVHVGDPFVVKYTFDTSTPDLLPDNPDQGWYEGPTASLELPSVTYVSTSGLYVYPTPSPTTVLTFWTPMNDDQPRIFANFSGVTLSGDQLPIGWVGSIGYLTVKAAGNSTGQFSGTIIPEPSVLALILAGLSSITRRRR